MGRILKLLLLFVGALVALLVISIVVVSLVFDPNDFRDDIEARVETATGRELTIAGELGFSLFPWLAIEVGETRLGNAAGFGDEPFARFERARLSVRLVPLLLRREASIGAAELDGLHVNLEVAADGRSNWQDFVDRQALAEQAGDTGADEATGKPLSLDIVGVSVTDANIVYDNAQLGERYTLENVDLETGSVSIGEPIRLSGSFRFTAEPADASGNVELRTTVAFDADEATITLENLEVEGDVEGSLPLSFVFDAPDVRLDTEKRIADLGVLGLSALDVDLALNVEPFSYADSPTPVASLNVAAFSPRALMRKLDIDVPPTADPGALSKVLLDTTVEVTAETLELRNVELVLDDTTVRGSLSVPRSGDGTFRIELAGNRIDLARYMPPADETEVAVGSDEAVPVEIPVELIRALNVRGALSLETATLGDFRFDDLEAGINLADDKLRLHPLGAKLFDGSYRGDIRIDASGDLPVVSADEQIAGVSVAALADAMFDREDVTGTIEGRFSLSGRGADMGAVQRTLSGNVSFVLRDGAWESTDVWYQLRRARALFRGEQPPPPSLPARTPFSEVSATGVVTDGILRNDDFRAELPFMRLTGRGTVDLPAATADYSLSARVIEKPELDAQIGDAEMADMTKAVIPLKITGPLASPKFSVDFESLLRERAKKELRDRVLDKLIGDEPPAEGEAEGEAGAEGEAVQKDPEEQVKDELKKRLRDLIGD